MYIYIYVNHVYIHIFLVIYLPSITIQCSASSLEALSDRCLQVAAWKVQQALAP